MCCSNRWLTGVKLMVAGLIGVVTGASAWAADVSSSDGSILVHADGSIAGMAGAAITGEVGANEHRRARYDFELPRKSPERRWLEDDKLPICNAQWEKDGIRYTQIVLVTRLEAGDLMPAGKAAGDAVLMVQLVGENTTNAYTDAAAAFAAQVEVRPLTLQLREGLVHVTGSNAPVLLAAVDIPSGGIAVAAGSHLRFRGSMPPGTSGAMTIKIPAGKLDGEAAINRLRDLEFAEEFRRVKQFWADRMKAGDAPALPVTLSMPAK